MASLMQILLSPIQESQQLHRLYVRAFHEAVELYVASAYLTHWDNAEKLGSHCSRLVFIVGTDFGLTRKSALRKVLQWLPKHGFCLFGAVRAPTAGNFHPKLLAWRSVGGQYFCLIGSSNLSKAAFGKNFEANVFLCISRSEYQRVTRWLDSIAELTIPVSEDWIEHHYREARLQLETNSRSGAVAKAIKLRLPRGASYAAAIKKRRRKQAAFSEIAARILFAAKRCVKGEVSNAGFWKRFWELWSSHSSRFQGSGLEIRGKGADWRQACTSLLLILDASRAGSITRLDDTVSQEIDRLSKARNPARGAWLTEMLCHYFPDSFPVMNSPVAEWLKRNKWRARRRSTEGQRYIELAQRLRIAVLEKPAGARNLSELDSAIWLWVHKHQR